MLCYRCTDEQQRIDQRFALSHIPIPYLSSTVPKPSKQETKNDIPTQSLPCHNTPRQLLQLYPQRHLPRQRQSCCRRLQTFRCRRAPKIRPQRRDRRQQPRKRESDLARRDMDHQTILRDPKGPTARRERLPFPDHT